MKVEFEVEVERKRWVRGGWAALASSYAYKYYIPLYKIHNNT